MVTKVVAMVTIMVALEIELVAMEFMADTKDDGQTLQFYSGYKLAFLQ